MATYYYYWLTFQDSKGCQLDEDMDVSTESQCPEDDVGFHFAWMDHIHFFTMVITRQMIIGIKYGLYSEHHIKLVSNFRLSFPLNFFDLVINTVGDKQRENLWLRLGFRYDDL